MLELELSDSFELKDSTPIPTARPRYVWQEPLWTISRADFNDAHCLTLARSLAIGYKVGFVKKVKG